MDHYNIQHLLSIKPQDSEAEIELLGQYDPEGEKIIEDPYFVRLPEIELRLWVKFTQLKKKIYYKFK